MNGLRLAFAHGSGGIGLRETALDRSFLRARPWERADLPEEGRTIGRPRRSLWQCFCLRWNKLTRSTCEACGRLRPEGRNE